MVRKAFFRSMIVCPALASDKVVELVGALVGGGIFVLTLPYSKTSCVVFWRYLVVGMYSTYLR